MVFSFRIPSFRWGAKRRAWWARDDEEEVQKKQQGMKEKKQGKHLAKNEKRERKREVGKNEKRKKKSWNLVSPGDFHLRGASSSSGSKNTLRKQNPKKTEEKTFFLFESV